MAGSEVDLGPLVAPGPRPSSATAVPRPAPAWLPLARRMHSLADCGEPGEPPGAGAGAGPGPGAVSPDAPALWPGQPKACLQE